MTAPLASLRWPAPAGSPGVLIVPGLGSRKENHADFGEAVAAAGMGAMALDLHAAARDPRVRAVAAICTARPEGLARRVGADWPLRMPLGPAVARDDGVARGYWHATGDDRVPWGSTLALAGITPQPMRLRIALGGGHNTLQHDPAVIAETVAFLAEHLGAR